MIAWRLRALMRAREIDMHELVERLEAQGCTLSYSHFTRVVSGRFDLIRIELIVALCRALDCSVDELIQVRGELPVKRRRSYVMGPIGSGRRVDVNEKIGGIRPIGARIRGT
jgi:DNA-binding Xre family transcriptional regulator